jgi:hypothetical protein
LYPDFFGFVLCVAHPDAIRTVARNAAIFSFISINLFPGLLWSPVTEKHQDHGRAEESQ